MLGERIDTGQLVWRQHARRENGHGSACVEAACLEREWTRVSLYGGSMLGERTDTDQLVWRQHVRRENGHGSACVEAAC